MIRADFHERFEQAAEQARVFAGQFVVEALPKEKRFRVRLNSSFDGNPLRPGEFTRGTDAGRVLWDVSLRDALDALWWEGRVPEWIDVSVVSERGAFTVIELLACGRYTEDERLLYYRERPTSPCAVKGPVLPPDHQTGEKFSIHLREAVASLQELRNLGAHLLGIRFLECMGFDDVALTQAPSLPSATVLVLPRARLSRIPCLTALPRLEHCRVYLDDVSEFNLGGPVVLQSLTLAALPPEIQGEVEGKLDELVVTASCFARPLVVSAPLSRLSVSLDSGSVKVVSGERVASIRLHGRAFDNQAVGAILAQMPNVRSVDLRGTSVDNGLLNELEALGPLDFLDLVETSVTVDGLARARRLARKTLPQSDDTRS